MQRLLEIHGRAPEPVSPVRPALAAKGFRPFFLVAAAFAATMVPAWLLVLTGRLVLPSYLAPVDWHAHEMVFGFTVAVIAGFLLTAVGNWTGRETLIGRPLLALVALWAGGRIAMLFGDVAPRGAIALVDLAFVPALAVVLGRALVKGKNRKNFVMLAILGALFAANVVVHLGALGVLAPGWARRGSIAALDVILVLVVVIAGRVFPMFTRNATGIATIRSSPRLDVLTIGGMVAVAVSDTVAPDRPFTAVVAAAVAVLAVARAAHWGARHTLRDPLLWVLHGGYAWIPIGLLLRAYSAFDPAVPRSIGMHALTVGAIGSLTLGMMARVSLGHTGRALVAARLTTASFGAITIAAAVRVLAPLVAPGLLLHALVAAAAFWTLGFVLFLVVHLPILTTPRIDRR